MKTRKLISGGDRKSFTLLTVFFLLAGTMSVQAETKYDLYVGGVQVTSSNKGGITGGAIKSGTVTYNPDSRILTLTDVTIECKDKYKNQQGIYNEGIQLLKVELYGKNNISSIDNAGLQLNAGTIISVETGTTWIESDNLSAAYINGNAWLYISTYNNSKIYITGYYCPAVKGISGTGSGLELSGKNLDIHGNKGDLVDMQSVEFRRGCDVTLDPTDNSNYPNVINVRSMYVPLYETDSQVINYSIAEPSNVGCPLIKLPLRAEFNANKKTICNSNGAPVYNEEIVINDQYAAVANTLFFPDTEFCEFIEDQYGLFITQNQINDCIAMDVGNKTIGSLEGIQYFPELQTLKCSNNNLTELDLSHNTKLIGVECDYNQLTSLTVPVDNLQLLGCTNNNLTSCLQNATYSHLKELYCAYNASMSALGCDFSNLPSLEQFDCSGTSFSRLDISSCTELKKLTCENNTSLTELVCSNTTLNDLSVSGCSTMRVLSCFNNNLSRLNVYGCSSLLYLKCDNNVLPFISDLSSCTLLQQLYCGSNKLSSLDLSVHTNLSKLSCTDNQLTSITGLSGKTKLHDFSCSQNKLKSIDLTGCSNLNQLICNNNQLTSLRLSDLTNLQKLDCHNNSSMVDLTLSDVPNLAIVNCSYCDLGSLDWYDLKLTTLDCSYNTNLTILNNSRDYTNPIRPLTSLNVEGCSALKSLSIRDNDELTTLDLTGCSSLTHLDCTYNKLTTLDLTPCPNLINLSCQHNNLTSIDLSNNSNIEYVYCGNNSNLSSLNVKNFSHLVELGCNKCQLQQLDLGGCSALYSVECSNNQISSLILPQESTALSEVYCYNNRLEGVRMGFVVSCLPNRNRTGATTGKLYALTDDANNEQNTCTRQHIIDAKSKNWDIYAQISDRWDLYVGPSISTSIRTTETGTVDDYSPCNNTDGQRVGKDYKGIVIHNGKKVVIK